MISMTHTARLTLAAAALTFAATPARAQTNFEGVVTFRSDWSSGKSDTMTQTTKGENFRLDGMGDNNGGLIYDAAGKRIIMLEGAQKRAVVMTEAEQQQMQEMMRGRMAAMRKQTGKKEAEEENEEPKVTISKTGKTEVVAGTRCEVIHATWVDSDDKKHEGDACVADGVGYAIFSQALLSNPMFASGRHQAKWVEEYRHAVGPNKGILKIVSYKDRKPTVEMEAIRIERKSIPASAFEPPPGYTVVNLGDMMRQMHGMQGQQQGKPPTH